jgi:hypothetical protein
MRWSVGFSRRSVRGEYQSMRSALCASAPSHPLHAMPVTGTTPCQTSLTLEMAGKQMLIASWTPRTASGFPIR